MTISFHEVGEDCVEFGVFADGDVADDAFGVDDELGGEALDIVVLENAVFSFGVVPEIEPGQFVFFEGFFPGIELIAAGNSYKGHLAVVFGVVLFHLGEAFDAPTAP